MTDTKNTYEQVYNVREDDNLSSHIATVICVLVQRGIMIAGFSITKELLTIHYTGYNKDKPVWSLDFFEHIFIQEPLLAVREKVKGVFILSDKNLIVPDALYDEANYLLAAPKNITELIKINFRKAEIQPLAMCHFLDLQQQSLYLQLCVSSEQVCATLHNYSQLLWHKVFSYTSAEDIAFEVKHFCIESNISPSKVTLLCNSLSAAEHDLLNELSQYFASIKSGSGQVITGQWDCAISLAHQLLVCVL
jgi:hypothetical protein